MKKFVGVITIVVVVLTAFGVKELNEMPVVATTVRCSQDLGVSYNSDDHSFFEVQSNILSNTGKKVEFKETSR